MTAEIIDLAARRRARLAETESDEPWAAQYCVGHDEDEGPFLEAEDLPWLLMQAGSHPTRNDRR